MVAALTAFQSNLVAQYHYLPEHMAQRLAGSNVRLAHDLQGVGVDALIKAAQRASVEQASTFEGFAARRIRWRCCDHFRRTNFERLTDRVDLPLDLTNLDPANSTTLWEVSGLAYTTPEETAHYRELLHRLSYSSLTKVQRTVLELRLQGMTNIEISQSIGTSETTTYRIVQEIKFILENGRSHKAA